MINRVAMLSVHTCPLAMLGGKETGGMNVYVRELTTELDKQGVTVDVFTRSQEPGTPVVHGILGKHSRVIHVPAGPEVPYNKNQVYYHLPEFVEGVKNRAIRENLTYDIIYSHYWLSGLAARKLRCIWGGTPIVQMFHTLGKMKNKIAQTPEERDIPLRINSEEEIMKFADHLIAATPIEKKQLIDLYQANQDKISVIPPGVNLKLFNPLPKKEALQKIDVPSDHNLILFVGRIQPLKGIDGLIIAMSIFLKRYPELKEKLCISIIGGNPNADSGAERVELDRLRTLKKSLGVADLITFLGAKDQNTLVNYYSAAQMVVMPSHYESFGMVAIEAMACGTPVIAYDVGGLTYIIEDGVNGYLVPPQDYNALADKIGLLLKYPVLREHLSEHARRWVQRFSWSSIANDLLLVYNKLLTNKKTFMCMHH